MARIRSSLFERLKNGMRRFLPAKPALMSRCFSSWRHRITEVNRLDTPAPDFKFVLNDPVEVAVVDGIVRAEGGGIVIIDHGLVSMLRILTAEVLDECRNLTLELDVERLNVSIRFCAYSQG